MVEDVLKIENMNFRKRTTQPLKDNKNSFINNLLDSIQYSFLEIRQALIDVENLTVFDNNAGKNLDNLGSNIKEYRNGESDQKYLTRIKLAHELSGTIGDINIIIRTLSSYLKIDKTEIRINEVGDRKILVELPDTVDKDLAFLIIKKIKAAGVRLEVQFDKYWEDFTYQEIEQKTYENLAKYRYERGGNKK